MSSYWKSPIPSSLPRSKYDLTSDFKIVTSVTTIEFPIRSANRVRLVAARKDAKGIVTSHWETRFHSKSMKSRSFLKDKIGSTNVVRLVPFVYQTALFSWRTYTELCKSVTLRNRYRNLNGISTMRNVRAFYFSHRWVLRIARIAF